MKKNKILILSGSAIGVLVAAGICIYQRPEVKLLQASKHFQEEIKLYDNQIIRELDLASLYRNRQEHGYQENLECTMKIPELFAEDTFSMAKNLGLDSISIYVDDAYDNAQKRLQGQIQLGVGGLPVIEGDLFIQGQDAYFQMPEVLENVYTVSLDSLGKDYNHSEISEIIGEKLPDDFYVNLFSEGDASDWEELGKMAEQITAHAKQLKSYIKIENTSQKIANKVADKTISGKAIKVTIREYAINDLLSYTGRVLCNSNFYKNRVKQWFTTKSDQYYFEKEILGSTVEGDLEVYLYLDNKRNVIAVETKQDTMKCFLQAKGEDHLYDTVEMKLEAKNDSGKAVYDITKSTQWDENSQKNTVLCKVDEEDFLEYRDTWDWNNKSMEFTSTMPDCQVKMKSAFEDIVSGESFALQVANLEFILEDAQKIQFAAKVVEKPVELQADEPFAIEQAVELLKLSKMNLIKLAYETVSSLGGSLFHAK